AEVSLVGINIGTRTGPGGTFSLLNVPVGPRELRVLAIGFTVATAHLVVLPDQTTTTTLQLAPSVLQLDAIVVTGTPGQARVREVGNSIAQVNLSQVKDPPASMDQLLQARAPGLSVMQTSGMAGEGAQIRLRGAVSVSQSNQPIIYVDGVRVRSEGYRRNRPPFNDSNGFRGGNYQASPLNDINPADVDRVVPLDNEKKLSTRGNVGITLSDNLRIEWNTAYSNTDLSNTPAGNNAHGLVLNVFRAERNYRSSSDPAVIDSLLSQSLTTGI